MSIEHIIATLRHIELSLFLRTILREEAEMQRYYSMLDFESSWSDRASNDVTNYVNILNNSIINMLNNN